MRQYYHKNTYLINQVENGFTVEITGTKENQEDGILAGYYVFETIDGLTTFLTSRLGVDHREVSTPTCPSCDKDYADKASTTPEKRLVVNCEACGIKYVLRAKE